MTVRAVCVCVCVCDNLESHSTTTLTGQWSQAGWLMWDVNVGCSLCKSCGRWCRCRVKRRINHWKLFFACNLSWLFLGIMKSRALLMEDFFPRLSGRRWRWGSHDWCWLIDIYRWCMYRGLLSNHNESSFVRCITAARYATYELEKRRLDYPSYRQGNLLCSMSPVSGGNDGFNKTPDRWSNHCCSKQWKTQNVKIF